jgi:hypothetical protein
MTMFGTSIDFLTKQVKELSASSNRSISRIAAAGDSAKLSALDNKTGSLGKIIRIRVNNMSKQDSIRFFQNAISFMKFQEETILYANNLYAEMKALAQRSSGNVTSLERLVLNEQFTKLRKEALALNELTFNGKKLFDELAGSVEYEIDFGEGLFRNSDTWDANDSLNEAGFKIHASTQFVPYNEGILILDVNTGESGEQFVFGYHDEVSPEFSGTEPEIEHIKRGYYHWTEADVNSGQYTLGAHETYNNGYVYEQLLSAGHTLESDQVAEGGYVYKHLLSAGHTLQSDEVAAGGYVYEQQAEAGYTLKDHEVAVGGFVYQQQTSAGYTLGANEVAAADGYVYEQQAEAGYTLGDHEVAVGGFIYQQLQVGSDDDLEAGQTRDADGYVYASDGSKVADTSKGVADTSAKVADLNNKVHDPSKKVRGDAISDRVVDINKPVEDTTRQEVLTKIDKIPSDLPRRGITPIFDSSTLADFNTLNTTLDDDKGINTWDTGNGTTSDFDRFFIEWGPDQKTSFRFIPLSEGNLPRDESNFQENGTNLTDDGNFDNRSTYLENLGLPAFSGADNLWGLDDYEDTEFGENYKFLEEQNPSASDPTKAVFNPNHRATKKFYSQGDVGVYDSDSSRQTMQLRVNGKSLYQIRAQYYKPEQEETEVGNLGDFNTSLKPIGLGLLRDSEAKNFPELKISSLNDAQTASSALDAEMDGLIEQMGTLGTNMAKVISSLDAVNKQLGIQQDVIEPNAEQVLSEEFSNLAKVREMRSFNASLMNRVVQINHDMVNLLLR